MRVAVILLLLTCILQGSVAYSRQSSGTITLTVKNKPLLDVFKEIKKQTGFTAFYNESLSEKVQTIRVSLVVKKATLEEVLKLSFKGSSLSYKIIGNTVVIVDDTIAGNQVPAEEPVKETPVPEFSISGIVVGGQGERMENVNVIVKRTGKGVVTDKMGMFRVAGVVLGDELVCSRVGYVATEVKLINREQLYVTLVEATNVLDQVVLQGYGKTSRRLSTGNISRVSAKEIEKQPVANPLLALQGRVPGLVVTQNNGYASAPVNVAIRGISSLTMNSEPLYIVDGVPVSVKGLKGVLFGNSFTGGQSPLFNINPRDIESIEVLKDADATAIYGSRGTNGIILITTKKGTPGATRLQLNATQGIQTITRHWDMLNTAQYLEMRREALKNDGLSATATNSPDLLRWDPDRNTNWQKKLWGGTGSNTSLSLGVSGGDNLTTFRINANYTRITNITTISGATQQGTMALGLAHRTPDHRFSVDLSLNYAYNSIDVVNGAGNAKLAPNAPGIFDEQGNLNWSEWNLNGAVDLYPFGTLMQSNPQKTNALTSSFNMSYRPFRGFSVGAILGYTFTHSSNNFFNPIRSQNPYRSPTGFASFNTNRVSGWNIEPQANYHFLLGRASVDVLFGATLTSSSGIASAVSGSGYNNDDLLHSITNAPVIERPVDEYSYSKYLGAFGRISYNLKNRYIINLNGRRDGSSNFGPGRQFGNFGSVGLAWIASGENWMKKILPGFVSLLKLRGSYGSTGNAGGGAYQYLSLWGSSASVTEPYPYYNGVLPYIPQNPPNQNYYWEVNRKAEGAVDLGLLDNKINLSLSYYRNRTGNQITSYPLPIFTGFGSIITNLPATIQNSGWEAIANAQLIQRKNFSLSANFNISANRNKLISFPDLATSPYANLYVVGKPLTTRYLLHYLGINPLTGKYVFEDHDQNGVISSGMGPYNPDSYKAVDLAPKYYGGFGTNMEYKQFSLSAYFMYMKQTGRNALLMSGAYGEFNQNLPQAFYRNHWSQPGDQNRFPALTTINNQNSNFFGASDGAFTDASFIRLNNLAIAYRISDVWLKRTGIRNLSVGVNAQNILTITRYEGLDPETQNFGGMPPVKTYVFSVLATF